MKLPVYNPAAAKWDEFRRFHNSVGWRLLRVFETGEALLHACDDPELRRHVPETSLRIVGSTDDGCPRFMLPERAETVRALQEAGHDPARVLSRPIPAAWLNFGGMSTLLIDTETGRTVSYCALDRDADVPQWVRNGTSRSFAAYIPGPGRDAVGNPIRLDVTKLYSAEERHWYQEIKAQCEAWVAMCNGDPREVAPKYATRYSLRYPLNRSELPARCTLNDILPENRFRIAIHGYAVTTCKVTVDHLVAVL